MVQTSGIRRLAEVVILVTMDHDHDVFFFDTLLDSLPPCGTQASYNKQMANGLHNCTNVRDRLDEIQ